MIKEISIKSSFIISKNVWQVSHSISIIDSLMSETRYFYSSYQNLDRKNKNIFYRAAVEIKIILFLNDTK